MEHGLELISPRLEILEIEVFNIIYNPGNIENVFFQYIFHTWTTDLINSGLKLLLYGTRLRTIYSPPGNIGNRSLQHSL